MKKFMIAAASLVFVLFSTIDLLAIDWSAKNITVEDAKTAGDETWLTLRDRAGRQFDLRYLSDPTDDAAENVLRLNRELREWNYMQPKQISFSIENSIITVVVVPERYVYKGINFASFLPAGMLFTFSNHLSYEFRVLSNNIFVKVKAKFVSEERLTQFIEEAINDPLLYMEKRDPEYFYRQLVEIKNRLKGQEKHQIESDQSRTLLIGKHGELLGRHNELSNDHGKLKKSYQKLLGDYQKLLGEHNELLGGHNELLGGHNELLGGYNELLAGYNSLLKEHNSFVYAVLTFRNSGFLGGGTPLNRSSIKKVVEFKSRNPAMTNEQLTARLESEGLKITSKELGLVLGVYFNIFE